MHLKIPPNLPCLPAGRLCQREEIITPLRKRGERGDFHCSRVPSQLCKIRLNFDIAFGWGLGIVFIEVITRLLVIL
jgi:hypothetical protein